MAQVNSAPAGKYGQASPETLGIWHSVAGKVAQTENVHAALLLVSRGWAPLGIVYRTDAAAALSVTIVGAFPETSHPSSIYPIAAPAGTSKAAAKDYLAFRRTAPARASFEKEGFTILPATG